MESSRPQLLILADAPDALCTLFGISLVERLLRIMQRLGFRKAVIISDSEEVAAHLTAPSWARADVALSFHRKNAKAVSVSEISADSDRTSGRFSRLLLRRSLVESAGGTKKHDGTGRFRSAT